MKHLGIILPTIYFLTSIAFADVPYDRSLYGHWIDADGDCQDTRQEVLIQESLIPPTMDITGCEVVSGRWYDHYTGKYFSTPTDLHVDHLVSLKEAHISGAGDWTPDRRQAFANDLEDRRSLIVVSSAANQSKGSLDPVDWMPPNGIYRCLYLADWLAVKQRWELEMDAQETRVTRRMKAACVPKPIVPNTD